MKHLLKRLAHFQVEHPYKTVLLIIALTVMIYGGVSQVRTVASLEQMMPPDIQEIKAFQTLRDNGLGQDIIAIILEVDTDVVIDDAVYDITDYRVYGYISDLQYEIELQSDVIETYSYVDMFMLSGQQIDDQNYHMVLKDMQGYLSQYVNQDKTITIIMARTDLGADDTRMQQLSQQISSIVDDLGNPPGIEVKYTGTPVIQQRLGELIALDRANTQWISTFMVFIIVMLIFRTFTSAVVPIVIVTLSVNWLYGTMGYADLPISTLAGGVAAMVIGIGIDFAIHIMNKFKYERKKGYAVKKSIELAVSETGMALIYTSLTTIAAFMAFLVGDMPEMGRFGLLMTIGISYSLIFSLIGLPALLVIEEDIIHWLKKKLRFGIEPEYKLSGGET